MNRWVRLVSLEEWPRVRPPFVSFRSVHSAPALVRPLFSGGDQSALEFRRVIAPSAFRLCAPIRRKWVKRLSMRPEVSMTNVTRFVPVIAECVPNPSTRTGKERDSAAQNCWAISAVSFADTPRTWPPCAWIASNASRNPRVCSVQPGVKDWGKKKIARGPFAQSSDAFRPSGSEKLGAESPGLSMVCTSREE